MRVAFPCVLALVCCDGSSSSPQGLPLAELNAPVRVLVDDDNAYVTTVDGVVRVPLDGGAQTILLPATVQLDEAMDDEAIYVLLGDTIQRVPKDGGPTTTLVTDGGVYSPLAVNSSNVFWSTRDALLYVSKSGGSVSVLASSTQADALAVDDDYAYWMTQVPVGDADPCPAFDEYVVRAAVGGSAPETLSNSAYVYGRLPMDDGGVYWSAGADFLVESIVRFDKATHTITTLSTSPSEMMFGQAAAVDGPNVYWARGTVISTIPRDGGVATFAQSPGLITDIVARRGVVYWTDFTENGYATQGPGALRMLAAVP